MDRIIFHVDVNSAFLSWSAVKRLREDPQALDLRTVPSAVGGDVKTRHGIITAKAIPAKKYGIQTGEPVMKALQKCPDLILVPGDRKTYKEYSRQFIAILKKYAEVVEQVSIDEAYMDMTGAAGSAGSREEERQAVLEIAAGIRKEIRESLGFTVNVGISSNKLLAKMASDFQKPDRTHTLFPDEVAGKMWPLPIRELHGCGGATAARLNTLGIITIGDAAGTDPEILKGALGEKAGAHIWRAANGISNSPVRGTREKAKSYSNETTMAEDITGQNYGERMPAYLRKLSESVGGRMRKDAVRAYTIGVIVKTDQFHRHTRQKRLDRSTSDPAVIEAAARELMDRLLTGESGLFSRGRTIRLVGVSAAGLDDSPYEQMSLFDWLGDPEESGKKGNPVQKQDPVHEPFPAGEVQKAGRTAAEQILDSEEEKAYNPTTAAAEDAAPVRGDRDRDSAADEKKRRLDAMMDTINRRFGQDTVRKGGSR